MNLHERENRLCQLPRVSYDPGGPVEGERGREGFVLISEAHPPGQAAVMAAGGGVVAFAASIPTTAFISSCNMRDKRATRERVGLLTYTATGWVKLRLKHSYRVSNL